MKNRVKLSILALAMVISTGLTACSGESSSSAGSGEIASSDSVGNSYKSSGITNSFGEYGVDDTDYSYDKQDEYAEEQESSIEDTSSETDNKTDNNDRASNIILAEDKLVYRCTVDIETLDFDESYSALQDIMSEYNCIVESEDFGDDSVSYFYTNYYSSDKYISGKTDTIVIRVPSDNYKKFVNDYGKLGNIVSKNQTVENITQKYYDTTSQVNGLKEQMSRLESMLEQATEIEDMIIINKEITDLQSQINSLTTQIITMDTDVAYSYVTLTLKEVVEYTDMESPVKTNTFIDRLKNQCIDTWKGFLQFLENLVFAIIGLIPAIVILGVVYIVIRLTCKNKIKAWKEKRKQQKETIDRLIKYNSNKNEQVDVNVREHDNKKEI